ncbi:hypothetical protein FZC74_13345 [Sutcliffiella horikoshii]|uniref:Uncharacterized protein n=1 Tax=Sutcliffiella horikoshii TaxID=79883 RepID=A0AA94WPJ3_9BACI|nr:hypothetical protein FZC74_13345 [Sutcliffiella horikoshii]
MPCYLGGKCRCCCNCYLFYIKYVGKDSFLWESQILRSFGGMVFYQNFGQNRKNFGQLSKNFGQLPR